MRGLVSVCGVAIVLAGCSGPAPTNGAGQAGVPHLEAYCSMPGLAPALRQTVVVVDQQEVRKAPSAAQIRVLNPELFQLIEGLGNPQSVESGAMAAREHLAIYLAPTDGSAPKLVFTGCIPGISAAERKEMAGSKSGAAEASDSFFGKGPAEQAREAADHFHTALLGALVQVSNAAPDRRSSASILDRSLTRSLQATTQLAPPENGVPRLFFFTDLNSFAPDGLGDETKARTQGFADADKARLPLGRAEVHLIGPKAARDPLARDYAQAFFLGSEGRMLSWGGATFNTLPPPPVKVADFSGDVAYPPYRFPAQVRLAADRTGGLVDSWFIIKKERSLSTPLTGSLTCDADQNCQLTTDQGGFAQAWARKPGPDPEFNPELPLGGLRQLSGEIRNNTLTGKVFDPAVGQIGSSPGTKALDFKMTRMTEARL